MGFYDVMDCTILVRSLGGVQAFKKQGTGKVTVSERR